MVFDLKFEKADLIRKLAIFLSISFFAALLLLWNTDFAVDYFIFVGIFAILAISLNIESGHAGLTNFGVVAFFAIGAYTALLFTLGFPIIIPIVDITIKMNFLLSLVVAIVAAGIAGYLVSLSTLKLREDYLAIVTIATGEILRIFFLHEDWLHPPERETMGGFKGLRIDNPFRSGFDLGLGFFDSGFTIKFTEDYKMVYLLLVWVFVILVLFFVQILVNSPFGRVMRGLREDDTATEGLGKDAFKYKTQVFVIGSAIAGLGGGLYGFYLEFISPDAILPFLTFTVWIMMIIGGKGNNYSSVVGAALITFLERSARLLKEETLDLFGWTITFEDYFPKLDPLYRFRTQQNEARLIIPADIFTLLIVGVLCSFGLSIAYKKLEEREIHSYVQKDALLALGIVSTLGATIAVLLHARLKAELIFASLEDVITPLTTIIVLISLIILGIIYVGGMQSQMERLGPKRQLAIKIILLIPTILFILLMISNIESNIDLELFSSRQRDIYLALMVGLAPVTCLAVAYIYLEEVYPVQFGQVRTALLVIFGLAAVWLPVTLTLMLPIDPTNFRLILTGALLIFFVMFRPEGIIPEAPLSVPYEKEGRSI
ncbi:MAG: branched-chain amino acid ABC transporter permease [Candidatus Hodarchaeota archaeon]